jgi:hypothetical protein
MGFIAVKRVKQRLLKAVEHCPLQHNKSVRTSTAQQQRARNRNQTTAAAFGLPLPSGCGNQSHQSGSDNHDISGDKLAIANHKNAQEGDSKQCCSLTNHHCS